MQQAYCEDVRVVAEQIRNLYTVPTDHHLVSTIAVLPACCKHSMQAAVGMTAAAELILRLDLWLTAQWPKHADWCHHLMESADFALLAAHRHIDAAACLQAGALVRRWLHPGLGGSLSSQQLFFDKHMARLDSAQGAVRF